MNVAREEDHVLDVVFHDVLKDGVARCRIGRPGIAFLATSPVGLKEQDVSSAVSGTFQLLGQEIWIDPLINRIRRKDAGRDNELGDIAPLVLLSAQPIQEAFQLARVSWIDRWAAEQMIIPEPLFIVLEALRAGIEGEEWVAPTFELVIGAVPRFSGHDSTDSSCMRRSPD